MSDAADGAVMLAHATAHAALLYGGQAEDYADIMWQAITDDHLERVYERYISSRRVYARVRAHQLIAEADLGFGGDEFAKARWIGCATAIMGELTRDA